MEGLSSRERDSALRDHRLRASLKLPHHSSLEPSHALCFAGWDLFVIVAKQMQGAVDEETKQLFLDGDAILTGLSLESIYRDGEIAKMRVGLSARRRKGKRKHVCWLVFTSKLTI